VVSFFVVDYPDVLAAGLDLPLERGQLLAQRRQRLSHRAAPRKQCLHHLFLFARTKTMPFDGAVAARAPRAPQGRPWS